MKQESASAEAEVRRLAVAASRTRDDIDMAMRTIVPQCFGSPCGDSLAAYLVGGIGQHFRKTRNFDNAAIEELQRQVVAKSGEWTRTSGDSPVVRLSTIETRRLQTVLESLRTATEIDVEWGQIDAMDSLLDSAGNLSTSLPKTRPAPSQDRDPLRPVRDGVTISAGAASLGVAASTLGSIIFVPAGAAIGAVAAFYAVRGRRDAQKARSQVQLELRDYAVGVASERVESLQQLVSARV